MTFPSYAESNGGGVTFIPWAFDSSIPKPPATTEAVAAMTTITLPSSPGMPWTHSYTYLIGPGIPRRTFLPTSSIRRRLRSTVRHCCCGLWESSLPTFGSVCPCGPLWDYTTSSVCETIILFPDRAIESIHDGHDDTTHTASCRVLPTGILILYIVCKPLSHCWLLDREMVFMTFQYTSVGTLLMLPFRRRH